MSARDVVREIRKATRRKFSHEEKIRIVLEGLRGEIPVSDLCRREGIAPTMYYRWSKAFLEAGKNGLSRDTQRDATTEEVRRLTELAKLAPDVRLEKVNAIKKQIEAGTYIIPADSVARSIADLGEKLKRDDK